MAFTQAMIQGANSSSGSAPQPSFDPNGTTMQAPLPTQPGLGSEIGGAISDQFSSGVNQVKQSLNGDTSQESLPEKGLDLGAGLASILTSPLAPAFKPIGDAITALSDKIGNIKSLQNFTQNHPEATDIITRVSKDVSNLASIAGTEAGGIESAGKLSDLASATKSSADTAATGSQGSGTPPDDGGATLQSRIADATPAYHPSMEGTSVTDANGESVPRVQVKEGVVGNKTITPSTSDIANGTELNNIEDYPEAKASYTEKTNAVTKAINDEAEGMRGDLQAEDKENPLNADAEKAKVTNMVRQNLPESVQKNLGGLSPEDNEFVAKMQESLGAPKPEGGQFDLRNPEEKGSTTSSMPKTPAGRYFQKVIDATEDYDGTREGKLNLRQAIDKAYKTEGGKYAYGSDSQSALQEIHSDIRSSINKDLRDTTQNTDTQDSLDKQSRLFRARDVLAEKAGKEASNNIGRYMDRNPAAKFGARIGTRVAMRSIAGGIITGAKDAFK